MADTAGATSPTPADPRTVAALGLLDPATFTDAEDPVIPTRVQVRRAARILRARRELQELAERRLIYQAHRSRTSQSVVAALLGTSQPTVSRIVKMIEQDRSILVESPTEVVNRRAAGEIDTPTMMTKLKAHRYTAGSPDPTGGDGFVRGDWSEIEAALTNGMLTDREYEQIAREAGSVRIEAMSTTHVDAAG